MTGPSYHGRTHAAGGSDPIPGLTALIGLPVARAVRSTNYTPAADASFHFPDWTTFTTNNAALSWTSGPGVAAPSGVYLVGYQVLPTTVPTNPDFIKASVTSQPAGGGSNLLGDIENQLAANDVNLKFIFDSAVAPRWAALQIISYAFDQTFQLAFEKDSGATVTFSNATMFVCRLGDYPT